MIVAGEASGDGHAAKLVTALREARPESEAEFFGAAGPKMRAAGVEAIVNADDLSIVGLAEIARSIPMFLRAFRTLVKAVDRQEPAVVILVDFPDFNLKLARTLKKRGVRVVYYISPQVWAWRQYRISAIKRYVDLLIAILPFEKEWYARRGVTNVEYVGNPLTREVHATTGKNEFCRSHSLEPSRPIIALLPGSRSKEIDRIFPVMADSAAIIREKIPGVQFVVPVSSIQSRGEVERIVASKNVSAFFAIVENETYDALNSADAAAVASGTATLETGIIGTPLVVVYKTSSLNYRLLEPMIDVPHYGLINLIAERRVAKELIQDDFNAETLAAELIDLLGSDRNAAMRSELKTAAEKLGGGGASGRAAAAILKLIE